MQKTKRNYFSKLREKNIRDNKQFWRTVKLLLFEKIKSSEKM